MKTIHKYPLQITDRQIVKMPQLAQILCVQVQHDQICIWAEVETNNPTENVKIGVYGTGNPVEPADPGHRNYIGTVQTYNGNLVWHVFEILV